LRSAEIGGAAEAAGAKAAGVSPAAVADGEKLAAEADHSAAVAEAATNRARLAPSKVIAVSALAADNRYRAVRHDRQKVSAREQPSASRAEADRLKVRAHPAGVRLKPDAPPVNAG
jgi:hypothetical protein